MLENGVTVPEFQAQHVHGRYGLRITGLGFRISWVWVDLGCRLEGSLTT